MKKVLVLLTVVATVSAYSQGTVNFNNRLTSTTPQINAPIAYAAGGPATAGNINGAGTKVVGSLDWGGKFAQAALYGGAAKDNLSILIPAVGFRTGAAAGFVNVGSAGERTIQGIAPASSAFVQIRAWDTGNASTSYEDALSRAEYYAGQSGIIRVTVGGGSPPLAAANLIDLDTGLAINSFSVTYVPEPSIIGLGLLGAIAGMVVFRRRQ